MPDRTLNWGDPNDAGTKYRTQDDDPAGGGNFVVAEDTDGNTVLLQWNPDAGTAGQWEYGGPVDLGGNDLSSVGSATVDSLEAEGSFNTPPKDETISNGSIEASAPFIIVSPESGGDGNLDNMTGGVEGDRVTISVSSGESITIRESQDGTGEFWLPSSTVTLDDPTDTMEFIYRESGIGTAAWLARPLADNA